MRILQINSVCGVGSTGRIATDLYKVLEEQGHECCIAYGRGTAPDGIKTIKIGTEFDSNMHALYTRISDKTGFASTKATKKFIKQVAEYKPDIIQIHNIHGYYINIEILFNYLKQADIPVIWTLHDCWSFTGHCAYFTMAGCDLWHTGCHSCPQRLAYPSSRLMDSSRWNYRRKKELFTSVKNMSLITPSEWLAGLVKQSFLKKYPIKVINNGIDLDIFKPIKSDFIEHNNLTGKFIILGVANAWDTRKGLSTFVELSKMLDEGYRIVLVGISDKQKQELPQNILAITKTDNITELAEIYTAADVFLNPSVEETMGLVTVEALACGTSAIVYNATAVPEMVDETCGIVVEEGNVNGLVAAIFALKDNNFDSDNCIKRAKLYEKNRKYNEYLLQYSYNVGE